MSDSSDIRLEVQCTHCDLSIKFDNPAPRFCQNCGGRLINSPAWHDDADLVSERLVQNDDGRWKSDDRLPESPSKASPVFNPRIPAKDFDAELDSESVTIPPQANSNHDSGPISDGAGTIVGGYQLIRWLGSGGMGVVWEAEEVATGRRVALKRLSPSMLDDQEYVSRFLREAQLAAKVSHPNVTFIYNTGEQNGQPFIAMELMPGETLNDRIRADGPMTVQAATDAILNVIDGLIAAHRMGLIHRDVKPSNCFLNTDDTVKIGDFGLSKSLSGHESHLTKTGTFMGTPAFCAPEQIRGERLDERTDAYSVGATLFNLLTGRPPFEGDSMAVAAQIITDTPPSVRQFAPNVPRDLELIIERCLEKNADNRVQHLEQLRVALMPFASHGTSLANFGRRVAAFMVDYILVALVILLVNISYAAIIGYRSHLEGTNAAEFMSTVPRALFILNIAGWLLLVSYFAIQDGFFGKTLGKRLMGLSLVNKDGERPGIAAALLRAVAIPGCFGISVAFGAYQYWDFDPAKFDIPSLLISMAASTIVILIPTAICLSTMRISNYMRGLHGFISGTRVVRLETDQARLLHIPIVQPSMNAIRKQTFGPYESNEVLADIKNGQVFLGHDKQLGRDVWIVTTNCGKSPTCDRIELSRVTRQRWLSGGNLDDGSRWDAYEAIYGAPILSLVGSSHADWQQYRMLLLDVAEELTSAISDGTMPEQLTLPQIWLDQHCHGRILDQCLVNVVVGNSGFQAIVSGDDDTPERQAVGLLQKLGDVLSRSKTLPLSAKEFLQQLSEKPQDMSTLGWAIGELKVLAKKTARLNWDTRAGILGGTLGLEFTLYSFLSCGFFLMSYYLFNFPYGWRFVLGLLLSLLAPVALGTWLRGGLVFRFMEIDVCTKDGAPASRFRCAIRSLISWFPALVPVGGMTIIAIFVLERLKEIDPIAGTLSYDWINHRAMDDSILSLTFLSVAFLVLGAIYSLRSPQRGLQDRLAGTRIIPH